MIALFCGRFDPPHLGHILTIMRVYSDYDKIIVAITDDDYDGKKKPLLSVGERSNILKQVFKFPLRIQVIYVGEGFRTRERFDSLPPFDIVLTGNQAVLKNMAIHKIRAKFIPRSQGIGFSGTELRRLIK